MKDSYKDHTDEASYQNRKPSLGKAAYVARLNLELLPNGKIFALSANAQWKMNADNVCFNEIQHEVFSLEKLAACILGATWVNETEHTVLVQYGIKNLIYNRYERNIALEMDIYTAIQLLKLYANQHDISINYLEREINSYIEERCASGNDNPNDIATFLRTTFQKPQEQHVASSQYTPDKESEIVVRLKAENQRLAEANRILQEQLAAEKENVKREQEKKMTFLDVVIQLVDFSHTKNQIKEMPDKEKGGAIRLLRRKVNWLFHPESVDIAALIKKPSSQLLQKLNDEIDKL